MALSQECYTPGPPAEEGGLTGKEEQMGGHDVYVNWPAGSTKAVVLASDVFGWTVPLFRKFADKIARAGFVSVIPNFLMGDPFVFSDKEARAAWFSRHPYDGAAEVVLAVIKELKDKGIKSVGIAGFCYGGKVAVLSGKDSAVDAIVVLHPAILSDDEVKALKAPFAILTSENEPPHSMERCKGLETYLMSQNKIEYSVKIFPGVSHGWTVRYDEKDVEAVKSAEEAHSDTINWFQKYL